MKISIVLMLLLLSGCAKNIASNLDPRWFNELSEVKVSYPAPEHLKENEIWVGWIYLNYDSESAAEAVVYVRDELKQATWELAEQTTPGYFGKNIARGRVGANGLLLEFPHDGFAKVRDLWVSGELEATANGRKIPKR